jgi:hypothetical protein
MMAQSSRFRQLARAICDPGSAWEVDVNGVDSHTVWRVLQLIYYQSYTTEPCPEIDVAGSHSTLSVSDIKQLM